MQSERLALLQGYSEDAFKRANTLLVLALSMSFILPLIVIPVCVAGHLPGSAYFPVCSALYGIAHLTWKAHFVAVEWAQTCASKAYGFDLASLLNDRRSRRSPVRALVRAFRGSPPE